MQEHHGPDHVRSDLGKGKFSQGGNPSHPRGAASEKGASSSQRATEQARRGEPPSADRPRDRSPKQENL